MQQLLLFSLLFSFSWACSASTTLPGHTGPELKVATFNVNFGLRGDLETAMALGTDVDVVCFQETNPTWERRLLEVHGNRLSHHSFVHRAAAGGLGVMSRYPIEEAEILEGVGWFPAMRIVVQAPLGPVQILNVHLRPPVSDDGSFVTGYFTTGSVREEEMQAFAEHLAPDLPTLIMGDFNEESGGDAVEWLSESRQMRDTLDALDNDDHTWRWTTRWGVKLTGTLDHILFDERLVPVRGKVIDAGRSDHLPVVATFARPVITMKAPPRDRGSLSF
ncbi:MAG: endonuclease/exonuclease/phosphatase family protein [Bradymonadia bacterium]